MQIPNNYGTATFSNSVFNTSFPSATIANYVAPIGTPSLPSVSVSFAPASNGAYNQTMSNKVIRSDYTASGRISPTEIATPNTATFSNSVFNTSFPSATIANYVAPIGTPSLPSVSFLGTATNQRNDLQSLAYAPLSFSTKSSASNASNVSSAFLQRATKTESAESAETFITKPIISYETNLVYRPIITGVGQIESGQYVQGAMNIASGTMAQVAPAVAVVAPEAFVLGATINVGLGEAANYATTGKFLTPTQVASNVATGGVSAYLLAGDIPQVYNTVTFAQKLAVKEADIAIPFGGLSLGLNAVGGLLDPAVFLQQTTQGGVFSNQSGTTSTTSQLQLQGQSTPPQSLESDLTYIYTNPARYLSFVAAGGVQGAQFGTSYGGVLEAGGAVAGNLAKAATPSIVKALNTLSSFGETTGEAASRLTYTLAEPAARAATAAGRTFSTDTTGLGTAAYRIASNPYVERLAVGGVLAGGTYSQLITSGYTPLAAGAEAAVMAAYPVGTYAYEVFKAGPQPNWASMQGNRGITEKSQVVLFQPEIEKEGSAFAYVRKTPSAYELLLDNLGAQPTTYMNLVRTPLASSESPGWKATGKYTLNMPNAPGLTGISFSIDPSLSGYEQEQVAGRVIQNIAKIQNTATGGFMPSSISLPEVVQPFSLSSSDVGSQPAIGTSRETFMQTTVRGTPKSVPGFLANPFGNISTRIENFFNPPSSMVVRTSEGGTTSYSVFGNSAQQSGQNLQIGERIVTATDWLGRTATHNYFDTTPFSQSTYPLTGIVSKTASPDVAQLNLYLARASPPTLSIGEGRTSYSLNTAMPDLNFMRGEFSEASPASLIRTQATGATLPKLTSYYTASTENIPEEFQGMKLQMQVGPNAPAGFSISSEGYAPSTSQTIFNFNQARTKPISYYYEAISSKPTVSIAPKYWPEEIGISAEYTSTTQTPKPPPPTPPKVETTIEGATSQTPLISDNPMTASEYSTYLQIYRGNLPTEDLGNAYANIRGSPNIAQTAKETIQKTIGVQVPSASIKEFEATAKSTVPTSYAQPSLPSLIDPVALVASASTATATLGVQPVQAVGTSRTALTNDLQSLIGVNQLAQQGYETEYINYAKSFTSLSPSARTALYQSMVSPEITEIGQIDTAISGEINGILTGNISVASGQTFFNNALSEMRSLNFLQEAEQYNLLEAQSYLQNLTPYQEYSFQTSQKNKLKELQNQLQNQNQLLNQFQNQLSNQTQNQLQNQTQEQVQQQVQTQIQQQIQRTITGQPQVTVTPPAPPTTFPLPPSSQQSNNYMPKELSLKAAEKVELQQYRPSITAIALMPEMNDEYAEAFTPALAGIQVRPRLTPEAIKILNRRLKA